ncbi:MFS transporter [Halomonas sp. McH1-25]|uniref:MFS transporter n=1 Tax=unclassified Halomonas TaxID=2609666 RepID=UPI001EF6D712|nr:MULTISPECIES: MFS transporter [unclassified Halomonas]MCG7600490.1 MFS transporter [Halomonas sp. McH1-25]MCP1343550.1 MFS transporter [Halomonas sp. FL8]MCP1359997.1 MFS transporter [Halomonas sp. BBD45]MCP1365088.1 MFS transporter [Halomonas sp. BBD48]
MAETGISQSRLFEKLTGSEDDHSCQDISADACREQPGNFVRQLFASLGNKLADELSSARLVLPWLLGTLGAPVWMVGLLVPIREAGSLLPQIVVAGIIRGMPHRKWLWVAGGVLQAACAVLLALTALLAGGAMGGALVLGLLVVLALSRGVSSIATKDVMGKTIAKGRRGTLQGWSGSVAGAVTLLTGLVLMLLDEHTGTRTLAALLMVAALGWAATALCVALIREERSATQGGENAWRSITRGIALLREDRAFLQFNVARSLLLSSALALPYIALLGQRRSGEDLGGLGILIVISGIAGMLSSPLWGKRADASSRQVMRDAGIIAALCCLAAAAIAWVPGTWASSIWPYALVYGLLVIAHAGVRLGRKTYVVDLADSDNRALYVAFSNTLTGVMLLVAGGVIGLLAHWLGSDILLLALALCALVASITAHRLPEVE